MVEEKLAIPSHVGMILDGNRRWAKIRGVSTLEGHRQGSEVFREIALCAFDSGVQYLSAYVFSAENWARTKEEVSYLMQLIVKAVEKYLKDFHKHGVNIRIVGRKDRLSRKVLKAIEKAESVTKDNNRGTLIICLDYSGQQEIIDATRHIIDKGIKSQDVDKQIFEQNLYAPDVPDMDLLIRTSGEKRLSGYMLWRSAYAELVFSDKLWPDYTVSDFQNALQQYNIRQRRFGV